MTDADREVCERFSKRCDAMERDGWDMSDARHIIALIERLAGDADWAEREVLEIMRIVGPGDGSDDNIIRLMKLTAIRRLLEADVEKYTALADKHMESADAAIAQRGEK